ncbi:guanine nucleotide-binding protein alpha subunit [Mycena belliarum]|uniref:Guanine nucleotide-binding protein alpha subunit n=1 Tax=Mycena belliarum TaxID=1033014 RepID=A0AAD6U3F3_9AGAR|nr:guanine nucleotide-binding protein alpha subunit [Mycena belliae]
MPSRTRTHHSSLSDPFAAALQPPADETPAARQARVAAEAEQQRVSDRIDDDLRRERAERKRRAKREVRVLLLGQSESGKSTVLKNFRLKYAPNQWKAELRAWRAVVQLNLIQNVLTLLDVMHDRLLLPDSSPDALPPPPTMSFCDGDGDARASLDSTATATAARAVVLTPLHQVLHMRLSPLRAVEADLRRRLGAGDPEFAFANGEDGALGGAGALERRGAAGREFSVRGWIGALGLAGGADGGDGEGGGGGGEKRERVGEGEEGREGKVDAATEILATVCDDIVALWEDPGLRELLRARGLRIEDRPGFFLSDTARITSRDYVPSDNDVVRARLRTLGVQEWRIRLEHDEQFGSEWVIYDVGGARSMRHAWLPFFDAVNAIIFLAPISCFDERLAEDPAVNRLEDSLLLWRAIVSSKLLGKTTLIVFLNKCDLLKRKLQSGIMVNKHLISFGARQNEVGVVVKCASPPSPSPQPKGGVESAMLMCVLGWACVDLKEKFKDILRADASEPRTTYLYATSVTDTKATAATLNIVRDGIIREHLKHAEFV